MDKEFWNASYKDDPGQAGVKDFFVEQAVENLPPGSALDVGCGTGEILLKLAAKGWSVTGVDIAEEAIRLAGAAARERGLEATFVAEDSVSWQAPQQYDLVFSSFAMPEGAKMNAAVAGMVAALRPGGTLIICEWDQQMAAVWGFGEEDLHALDAYVAAMPGLEIEVAESRTVANPFQVDAEQDSSGRFAHVAFIRAVKPH